MKRLLLTLGALALCACTPTSPTVPSDLPVVGTVCQNLTLERFDTALKAYDVASDAVNLLIDVKVITPKSSTALAIADANDKVLAGFAAAEAARKACNATGYASALASVSDGIAAIKAALPKK